MSQGISIVPLEERVEAAAAAGYVGFAFSETDLGGFTVRFTIGIRTGR